MRSQIIMDSPDQVLRNHTQPPETGSLETPCTAKIPDSHRIAYPSRQNRPRSFSPEFGASVEKAQLIDIQEPGLNLNLNGCFYGLAVLAALSVVPWRLRERRKRWTLWLPPAALALYLVYETTMPVCWNIRLDLLLILPLLLIVVLAWLVRLVLLRHGRRA